MASSQAIFALFNQLTKHEAPIRVDAVGKLAQEVTKGEEELKYSVKRLVRGLSSSRAAARQGFALGLCTLIKQGTIKGLSTIVDELEADTKITKKERGEEERDKLVGRAFGYLSLIQSGGLDNAGKIRVAKGLVALAKEKTWIRELCIKAMCLLVELSDEELLDELEGAAKEMMTKEKDVHGMPDPATIALLITFEFARGPESYEFLTKEKLVELSKSLAVAWRADPVRLHIVWEQLCRFSAKLGLGKDLWTTVAEPTLLKGAISPEKKCAGFLVFGRLAQELARAERWNEIPQYLTSRVVLSSVLTHAKSKKMALNEPARLALKLFVSSLTEMAPSRDQDQVRLQTCKELLRFGDFDGKSGTSSLHDIMAKLGEKSANELFGYLKSHVPARWAIGALVELARAQNKLPGLEKKVLLILFEKGFFKIDPSELKKQLKKEKQGDDAEEGSEEEEKATSKTTKGKGSKKQVVADKKSQKKSSKQQESEDEQESEDDKDDEDDDMEEMLLQAQAFSRQRFFTVLKKLAKSSPDMFKDLLEELHAKWEDKVSRKKWETVKEETDEMKQSLRACKDTWTWLSEAQVGEVNKKIVQGFETLVLFVGLLLIVPDGSEVGDETELLKIDVLDLVEDLSIACKEIVSSLMTGKKSTKRQKKSSKNEDDSDEKPDPVAVTMQVCLTLLSQPSSLIRDLVAQLSKALAMNIANSLPALELLGDILTQTASTQSNEDEEEEEEVEMDPEEDDEDDEADEDDQGTTPLNAQQKRKFAKQAQLFANKDDEEDDDEEEESDEDIAIEEMEAYDRALGEYLKHRKASTQKAREAAQLALRRESIAFKLRVVDILEAVIARAGENRNLFYKPVLSLLQAAEVALPEKGLTTDKKKSKQLKGPAAALFQRLQALLHRYFKGKIGGDMIDSVEEFEQQLQSMVEFYKSTKNKLLAKLVLETVAFYIRIARKNESISASSTPPQALSEFIQSLIRSILVGHSNSTMIDADTFNELFIQRFPEMIWTSSLQFIGETVPRTPFQRMEQINMLSKLLRVRKESIPDSDLKLLRGFAVQKLSKENEELIGGKSKPERVKTTLKFVQQVKAFGSDESFMSELEPLFASVIQHSNSPAVQQMIIAMSNRKDELEKLRAASLVRAANKQQQQHQQKKQQQQQQLALTKDSNKEDDESGGDEGSDNDEEKKNASNNSKDTLQKRKEFFEDAQDGKEEDEESDSKKKKRTKNDSTPSKKQKKEGKSTPSNNKKKKKKN